MRNVKEKLSQINMFVEEGKSELPGTGQRPLGQLCWELETQQMVRPYFQRDYVWEAKREKGRKKVKEWWWSIVRQDSIGVIVTYQIGESGGTKFLADGFQRLTATMRVLEDPKSYGINMNVEEAEAACWKFMITVQHRIYKDHEDAMTAFHNLNQGTPLIPAEFYKGRICRTEKGKRLYNELRLLLEKYEGPLASGTKVSRERQGILTRDALAMFYQYSKKWKKRSFWQVAAGTVEPGKTVIEDELFSYIDGRSWQSIEDEMKNFEQYIASQIVIIREVMAETNQEGKAISRTLLRWLLHLAIWKRNTGRPVELYTDFLERLFNLLRKYRSFPSRFDVPIGNNETKGFSVSCANLTRIVKICESLGSALYEKQARKRGGSAIGYDDSHILPFSEYGDGPTIKESSSRNRSRGNKEIAQPPLLEIE